MISRLRPGLCCVAVAIGDRKLHAVVENHRDGIAAYLRRHNVAVDEPILGAISKAVRLSANTVTFHRLVPLPGFVAALRVLEGFGRVADLAIACGPERFTPAKLPP